MLGAFKCFLKISEELVVSRVPVDAMYFQASIDKLS